MKIIFKLVFILFLGAFLGWETYTKLTGEKPVPVALNTQENRPKNRPAEKKLIPTTSQAEPVLVSRWMALKEAQRKQQHLLPPLNPPKVAVAKKLKSSSIPVLPAPVPMEETVENITFPPATQAVPPAVSLVVSDPVPTREDSTTTSPKKKRKFLGIFPIKDKG